MNNNKIYFAPIQEFTDAVYRNVHACVFHNVDKYFAPYIGRQNDGSIKKTHLREIFPQNTGYNLIPQIMAGNSEDLIFLANTFSDMGYNELNWNLGCPYPMVVNKGMGAALLKYPLTIKKILDESLSRISCRISVKLRAGLNDSGEILSVIPVLDQFPLSELILHPRTAKQLYRGSTDKNIFLEAGKLSRHKLIYNGDILSAGDFQTIHHSFKETTCMIGRGILKNPFLPSEIKEVQKYEKSQRITLLTTFHDNIFDKYTYSLNGKSHLLMKMVKFWSYFCFSFPDPHKSFKRIKKAGSLEKYHSAVNENFKTLTDDKEN